MAKKTRSSRSKTSRKTASRSAPASKSARKKTTTRKKSAPKPTTKGSSRAATTKKSAKKTKKAVGRKPARRSTGTAKTAKKTAKKTAGTTSKKPPQTSAAKPEPASAKSRKAPPEAQKPTPAAAAQQKSPNDKPGRKGITIVNNKSSRRSPARNSPPPSRPRGGQLLGPGSPKRPPLIPSGPTAPKPIAFDKSSDAGKVKSPFKKRELEKFRKLLLDKRASLIGDVSQLESEALTSGSGSLSHTPQHMAEQGSDSADQTLSLGLAAADRRLIKEIDDALARIDNGTFGVCEMTGKPIRAERLRELPWARYSIDAARELERRMHRSNW